MLGHHYNTGATAGIIDQKHAEKMGGSALFLFLWAIRRQTSTTKDGWGVVLYGREITYEGINSETGFPVGTLRRWMATLREEGYLRTERGKSGLKIFIAKQKKFKKGRREISTGIPKQECSDVSSQECSDVSTLRPQSEHSQKSYMAATHTIHKDLTDAEGAPRGSKDLDVNTFKRETTDFQNFPSNQNPKTNPTIQPQIQTLSDLKNMIGAMARSKEIN